MTRSGMPFDWAVGVKAFGKIFVGHFHVSILKIYTYMLQVVKPLGKHLFFRNVVPRNEKKEGCTQKV